MDERTLADLAGAQHGVVSRAQLRSLGLGPTGIDRRVQSGRLQRAAPGVYLVPGAPRTWHQRLVVVCTSGGALASHRCAATLWHIDGFGQGVPEVSVGRRRRFAPPGVRVHQSTDLDRIEPVLRNGIPTTPLDRTVLDLGAVLRFAQYQLVVERVVRQGLLSWDELLLVLLRHARRGRDGVGRLRAVLDERYGAAPTGSDFEVLVEKLLVDAGLGRPVRQHVVHSPSGHHVARIDLAYPNQMVAVELDGRAFHSDAASFERDRERQNRLVLLGWTVLRFTWKQLLERPHRIVAEVRGALMKADASSRRLGR